MIRLTDFPRIKPLQKYLLPVPFSQVMPMPLSPSKQPTGSAVTPAWVAQFPINGDSLSLHQPQRFQCANAFGSGISEADVRVWPRSFLGVGHLAQCKLEPKVDRQFGNLVAGWLPRSWCHPFIPQ